MERLCNDNCNPNLISPLTLAFVGDSVFDLFIREQLVCQASCSVGKLNKQKIDKVCCQKQAEFANKLMPFLTEKEEMIYKRGRNAHTSHIPKNASSAEYHSATGLEALFGYLYLNGDIQRIRELIKLGNT